VKRPHHIDRNLINANKNIAIIEDHHEALRVWRRKGLKGLTLVHIDAHMDFGFHPAKPIQEAINEARSIKGLKRNLEYALLFKRFHKDLDIQTNIGNYIYPAMRDGIVRDFYWVIPGGIREFEQSRKWIKALIRNLLKQDPFRLGQGSGERRQKNSKSPTNAINASLMGRRFVITTLEYLPVFNHKVLLDIDTDFLVVDSLRNAGVTSMIGKRKPWIQPKEFVNILREKIKNPEFTTIAYSVNGSFTPMKYKHLGDEIAYYLAPQHFDRLFKRKIKAAEYFNLFDSTGKKKHYAKATRLNPAYRAEDNNYGSLYLKLRRFSKAEKEFTKITRVDPKNPYALTGLGNIYLQKGNYPRAKKYFNSVLREKNLAPAIFGYARIEFKLGNLTKSKRLLKKYQTLEPMQGSSHNLLGDVYRKEKRFKEAVIEYKNAINLGASIVIDILKKLLKLSKHIDEKDDIIKYVVIKYRDFKKNFYRSKKANLKISERAEGPRNIEEKMQVLERLIELKR
jgi:tetratricopeptide (TPR) repeat protein